MNLDASHGVMRNKKKEHKMKKLIIITAIIGVAISAQAAQFNWKTGTSQQVYLQNTSDRAASLTARLFDAGVYSQTAIVEAFFGGTYASLTSLSTVTTSSTGAITTSATGNVFESSNDPQTGYFAVVSGDDIFISTYASVAATDVGAATLTFSGTKAASQAAATEWTTGMTASAGWYTATVPEPTSGLLMLLGVAGLALRRRRA